MDKQKNLTQHEQDLQYIRDFRIIDDTPLGKLMHDFKCTQAENMEYDVLAQRVKYFKKMEEGVSDMCKAMEEMRNKAEKEDRKGVEPKAERIYCRHSKPWE